jgi:hypothetical protein
MTVPSGHLDFQDYAIWRGPDFFAAAAWPLSASNPASAQSYVTNFSSLAINVSSNNPGGMLVTIAWYTDATLAVGVGLRQWTLPNGFILSVIVPALSNYVTFQATTTDVASTNDLISVYPTNSQVSGYVFDTQKARIGNILESVGANTSVTHPLNRIAQGDAWVHVKDDASSTHLTFQVREMAVNGALGSVVWEAAAPVTIADARLVVTDVPLALQITNLDGAAAHTCDYYFVVDGR